MDLLGIHFANPGWLTWLFLLPVMMAVVWFLSRAKHSTLSLGNPRLVGGAPQFLSAQLIPWALRFLVLGLCLIAAARPQSGQKKVEEKKPVTDLFVTFDVSSSMVSEDIKPSRILAAKQILSRFLDKVESVRVGLTIFARISFTQCPLTSDISIVKKLLANVEPAPLSIKVDGTAIGDALVSSLNRLQNGTGKMTPTPGASVPEVMSKLLKSNNPPDQDASKPNSQAILLLTDGGNNAGMVDPLTAAKVAASRGVKIYAIGLGSLNKRIPAVFLYPDGRKTYGVDRNGNIVMQDPVDMGLLNELARLTGGKAYNAENSKTLQSVLDDIAKLEKREVATFSHWEYNELAQLFLLAAFFILAVDIVLEMTVLRTLP